MKIDSILKVVWLIVGGLILICILGGIFLALDLNDAFGGNRYRETGVTIDNASKENLERVNLELSYGNPINLGNSDNYMLKAYVLYKENEQNLKAGFDSYSSDDMEVNDPSNIIFLDKDLNPIQILLSQKALIVDLEYPQGDADPDDYGTNKEMKFILYEIVFVDTDQDGQLDSDDHSDLYISDLDGKNFTSITKDLEIKDVEFLDNYETILIQYVKDNEETDRTYFVKYSVTKKELTSLTNLDTALQSVQEILTK